ncbi:polymorphic toxin type 22 domain-containing protein, partial [Variovorax sp. J22R24]|uniref:polymorphic toxin type 22 domain-containing protein n=1 Tax=Variovorax gracilis TaxID=3053502 RepID=UPI0025772830
TMVSMAVLNAVASLVLQMMQRVAAALWSADVVNALTGLDAEGFTNQALQQGGFRLLMTVLIVCAPPMAARFFRGAMGSFMPFSAFGQGQGPTARPKEEFHSSGLEGDSFRLATGSRGGHGLPVVDEIKVYAFANPYGLSTNPQGTAAPTSASLVSNKFDDGFEDFLAHEKASLVSSAYGSGALIDTQDGGAQRQPVAPLTAQDYKAQADRLMQKANQLQDAEQWARSQGLDADANNYRVAAQKAFYASNTASMQAISIESTSNIPKAASTNQFRSDWSYMGANSSGIDVNKRGFLTPDYQVVAASPLSAAGGIARNSHDGTIYMFGGVAQTNPRSIAFEPAATGSVGWIFGDNDARSTNSFLSGDASQAFISIPTPWRVNLLGAITRSYGSAYALELGLASPAKVSYGVVPILHSTIVFDPNKR